MSKVRLSGAAFMVTMLLLLLRAICAVAAEDATEEKPYDERGFIRDDVYLSLAFTQGSTDTYDYTDFRIYLAGRAHYAFKGDDYLDVKLLVNRFDRDYDNPRYPSGAFTNIFDMDLTYVFGGRDKYTHGIHHALGASFFSTEMFDDLNFGVGYGAFYTYKSGVLRALAGAGRNLGCEDDWSPLAEFSWTHNHRISRQWRLITKADLMWTADRAAVDDDGAIYPDTIYVLDGALYYQVIKNWSLYVRYFNDNASSTARSYVSLGVSHRFRRPARRR